MPVAQKASRAGSLSVLTSQPAGSEAMWKVNGVGGKDYTRKATVLNGVGLRKCERRVSSRECKSTMGGERRHENPEGTE